MDIVRRLGTLIRQRRKARDWSQEDLAHRAGLDRSYVSGIERGVRNPTIETLHKIASALELTVSELVDGLRLSDRLRARPRRRSRP